MYVHTLSTCKFPRPYVKVTVGSERQGDIADLHKVLYDVSDVQVSTIDVGSETAEIFEKMIGLPVPARHGTFPNFYAIGQESVQNLVNNVADIYKTLSDVETCSDQLSDLVESIDSDETTDFNRENDLHIERKETKV